MSVIVSKEKTWIANKWISLKLFRDCLLFLDKETKLKKEISFLEKVSIDTLDLSELDITEIELFGTVVENVISYNERVKGTDMHDASYFKMYYDKLLELKCMIK
jgi:hypothetical protein